jgi:hypothetical protein
LVRIALCNKVQVLQDILELLAIFCDFFHWLLSVGKAFGRRCSKASSRKHAENTMRIELLAFWIAKDVGAIASISQYDFPKA